MFNEVTFLFKMLKISQYTNLYSIIISKVVIKINNLSRFGSQL